VRTAAATHHNLGAKTTAGDRAGYYRQGQRRADRRIFAAIGSGETLWILHHIFRFWRCHGAGFRLAQGNG
jgi:hypothetical protein